MALQPDMQGIDQFQLHLVVGKSGIDLSMQGGAGSDAHLLRADDLDQTLEPVAVIQTGLVEYIRFGRFQVDLGGRRGFVVGLDLPDTKHFQGLLGDHAISAQITPPVLTIAGRLFVPVPEPGQRNEGHVVEQIGVRRVEADMRVVRDEVAGGKRLLLLDQCLAVGLIDRSLDTWMIFRLVQQVLPIRELRQRVVRQQDDLAFLARGQPVDRSSADG